MTAALFGSLCGFLVVLAYGLGFRAGNTAAREARSAPHTAPDQRKALQQEQEEKAFQDCMNYSIDTAYRSGFVTDSETIL